MEGQAVASALMLELCGARPVGGTIDMGGPGPAPVTLRLSDARTERLLGAAVPRDDAAGILTALGFGVAAAPMGSTSPCRLAPRRRDPRGGPDRGGRADLGAGPAPVDAALAPRRGRPARARAAASPPGRGRAGRRGPLRGGRLELHQPRGARPARPAGRVVALENPMSEDQSVMRTTLLGSLLDALRRNRSRGFEDVRLFEAGSVYLRARRPATATAATGNPWYPATTRPADERTRIAALLRPRPAASWGDPEPPRADLFAVKGVLEAMLRALRADWTVEPAREPFLHPPGRPRVLAAAATPAGSANCTRRSPRDGTSTPSPASSSTSACSRRRRPASPLRGPHLVPRGPPGHRRRRRRRRPRRAGCSRSSPARAARCCATRACSTSTAAHRWGRAAPRWRCG